MIDQEPKKALGLCSGGLDSILSALVLRNQGVVVEWVSFETPFFSAEKAARAADFADIPLRVVNITERYLEMMKNPPCGFGKHMNPCLDCHTLMFRLAGQIMREEGFDFLFSGEVAGQRPMSQTKPSLRYVEKNSGFDGYILRPLSARVLPETIPEKKGWVDREKLLDFSGRSRKPQIKLARAFGVVDYPAPAGGCLLTDKGFSQRLKDLFDHQDVYPESQLHLLKFGRHLRLDENTRIVVGRNRSDNKGIQQHISNEKDIVLKMDQVPGPLVVMPGGGPDEMILLAASICAGYSRAENDVPAMVNVVEGKKSRQVQVLGLPPAKAGRFII